MKNNGHIPSVSILISTYNRADFLRQAVQSVLEQSFEDFEVIICDDASVDSTLSVCKELEQHDLRVRTIRHERNLGMVGNWNSGLNASRGHYFVKLDDDNCFLPTFLEKTITALRDNPDATYVFTDEWFIDVKGTRDEQATRNASKRYGRSKLASGLYRDTAMLALRQTPGLNSSVFIRQHLIDAGGFRTFAGDLADFDVFLNLAHRDCACCYIPERLLEYRTHFGANTTTSRDRISVAQSSTKIMESVLFVGEAEQLRKHRLAESYVWLARTLALQGNFEKASLVAQYSIRLVVSSRALFLWLLLFLPAPLLRFFMTSRYGKRFND